MKYYLLLVLCVSVLPSRGNCGEMIDTMPAGSWYRLTDHAGWKWYSFAEDTVGVVRSKDGVLERFTAENSGLASNYVTEISEDRHYNMWFIHEPSGIDSYACSRFDGVDWEKYYPVFHILAGGVNADGDFQVRCFIPYFETEMYYESIFDGSEWHAYLVGTSYPGVGFTRRYENGHWIVEGLDTDNITGGYTDVRPDIDCFPLTVGSTWSYRRTVHDFTDTVIMQVVGTVERDGYTWAVMLDGRAFRQDEEGNVYMLEGRSPYFDFRPCEGDNCDPYYLVGPVLDSGVYRTEGTFSVPAGTFDSYSFHTDLGTTIGGYRYSLSSGVGLVSYGYFTDFGVYEEWELLSYKIADKPVHVSDTESPPDALAITGAYPNPFNGSVTIEYMLPTVEQAVINVYNLAGQRVYRHDLGSIRAGRGEFVWSGRDSSGSVLSAGAYIIRLTAGDSFVNAKAMYLK